jgi:hypothetical protein
MKQNIGFKLDDLVKIVSFWKFHGFIDDDIYGKNRIYDMSYSGLKTLRYVKDDEIVNIIDNQIKLEKCINNTIELIPEFLKLLDFEINEIVIREFNDIETDKIKEIIVMHREQIDDKFFQIQVVYDSTNQNQAYLYINKKATDLSLDIETFKRFKSANIDFIKSLNIPIMVIPND